VKFKHICRTFLSGNIEKMGEVVLRVVFICLMLIAFQGAAQELNVQVLDKDNNPIGGAVVEVTLSKNFENNNLPESASMAQVNKRFVPHILTVAKGTPVIFPNKDSIKHHVYSFSPAKTFELKLYKESLPSPILLDKAGIISMGCNIHDWMAGYIYVAESQYFGQTDENGSYMVKLPAEVSSVTVWHPRFDEQDVKRASDIKVINGKVSFKLTETLYPNLDVGAESFDDVDEYDYE